MTAINPSVGGIAEHKAEPESFWIAGDVVRILVTGAQTGGAYALFEILAPPDPDHGPPPHIHDAQAETFHVLDGRMKFLYGDEWIEAGAGETVCVPAGVVHTFRNIGDRPSRMHVTIGPAGLDDYFRLVGIPVTRPVEEELAAPPPVSQEQIDRIIRHLGDYGMRLA